MLSHIIFTQCPSLKGKGAPKIHRCLWSKGMTEIRGFTKTLKVLLVNYTFGMEIDMLVPDLLPKHTAHRGLEKEWDERWGDEGERERERKREKEITSPGSSTNPADGVSWGAHPGFVGVLFLEISFPHPRDNFLDCLVLISMSQNKDICLSLPFLLWLLFQPQQSLAVIAIILNWLSFWSLLHAQAPSSSKLPQYGTFYTWLNCLAWGCCAVGSRGCYPIRGTAW